MSDTPETTPPARPERIELNRRPKPVKVFRLRTKGKHLREIGGKQYWFVMTSAGVTIRKYRSNKTHTMSFEQMLDVTVGQMRFTL